MKTKAFTPLGDWLYRHRVELLLNLLALLTVPLIAKWLWVRYESAIRQFGSGEFLAYLAGNGRWTDIGWEVASTLGWLLPGFSAYDSLEVLHPLIGMDVPFVDSSSHTHPPTSIPLGLPLVFFPYQSWLPYYMTLCFFMIAWSMRLLGVPPHIAYSLAVFISLTVPGRSGLVSTYPISALLVSVAWSQRGNWLTAGLAYGFYGASRGVGLILLLYPLVRRQARTLMLAIGVIFSLLLLAVLVEPQIIAEFFTRSRSTIEVMLVRPDLLSVGSVFRRFGYPESLAWLTCFIVSLIAWLRGANLFWTLNWLILAISPISWFHTLILALPLLVMIWLSGRLGQVLVLLVAASQMIQLVDPYVTLVYSIGPLVVVAAGAIAILSGSVGKNLDPPWALPFMSRARRDSNP